MPWAMWSNYLIFAVDRSVARRSRTCGILIAVACAALEHVGGSFEWEMAMNGRANILWHAMLLSLIVAMPQQGLAQNDSDQESEGAFLRDYSKLQPAPDNPFEEIYISPDAQKRASQYTAVMIDQPEIFVHPDSKYQGMKPDDMKAIADSLREAVANELKSGYQVVDQPATNVLYVRLAIGDVMLQKKKRPILAYTPIGAVVHAGRNAAKEVTEKIDLKDLKIEGEVLDSESMEQLGAMTASRQPHCRRRQAGVMGSAARDVRDRRQTPALPPGQLEGVRRAVEQLWKDRAVQSRSSAIGRDPMTRAERRRS